MHILTTIAIEKRKKKREGFLSIENRMDILMKGINELAYGVVAAQTAGSAPRIYWLFSICMPIGLTRERDHLRVATIDGIQMNILSVCS